MLYFNQDENTYVNVTYTIDVTPVIRSPAKTPCDPTIYDGYDGVALTIFDTGGADTVDLSWVSVDQIVNLAPEGISDLAGGVGNAIIVRGTVIENAIGGSGNDNIMIMDNTTFITLIRCKAMRAMTRSMATKALINGKGR